MNSVRNKIDELRAMSLAMPYGMPSVSLMSEAVQLCDSINDLTLSFDLRIELMKRANFSGRSDMMLVAFSWCLTQYDRDPARFNAVRLLWIYKWVVSACLTFPTIELSRIEQLIEDMDRRYRAYGSTMHAVWSARRSLFVHMRNKRRAKAAHAKLIKCRRDNLSNCIACAVASDVDYYIFMLQWQQAIEAAEPVINGGLSCTFQPHGLYASILLPLLHLQRYDEAQKYYQRGIRLIRNTKTLVSERAALLQYLVIMRELPSAKRLVERFLPGAMEAIEENEYFDFLQASYLWTRRLTEKGTRHVKIRLPDAIAAQFDQGPIDVERLGEWFALRANEIAARYDARNRTKAFQRYIEENDDFLSLAPNETN